MLHNRGGLTRALTFFQTHDGASQRRCRFHRRVVVVIVFATRARNVARYQRAQPSGSMRHGSVGKIIDVTTIGKRFSEHMRVDRRVRTSTRCFFHVLVYHAARHIASSIRRSVKIAKHAFISFHRLLYRHVEKSRLRSSPQ